MCASVLVLVLVLCTRRPIHKDVSPMLFSLRSHKLFIATEKFHYVDRNSDNTNEKTFLFRRDVPMHTKKFQSWSRPCVMFTWRIAAAFNTVCNVMVERVRKHYVMHGWMDGWIWSNLYSTYATFFILFFIFSSSVQAITSIYTITITCVICTFNSFKCVKISM